MLEKLGVEKVTMGAESAARMIGISYSQVCEMCRRGELPFIAIGNRRLFRVEALQQWMADKEQQSLRPQDARMIG